MRWLPLVLLLLGCNAEQVEALRLQAQELRNSINHTSGEIAALRSEIAALPEDDPYRDVMLARLDSAEAFIADTLPVVERMEATVADAEAGPAIALSLAEFVLWFTPLAGVAGAVGSHLRGRRTRAPPVP